MATPRPRRARFGPRRRFCRAARAHVRTRSAKPSVGRHQRDRVTSGPDRYIGDVVQTIPAAAPALSPAATATSLPSQVATPRTRAGTRTARSSGAWTVGRLSPAGVPGTRGSPSPGEVSGPARTPSRHAVARADVWCICRSPGGRDDNRQHQNASDVRHEAVATAQRCTRRPVVQWQYWGDVGGGASPRAGRRRSRGQAASLRVARPRTGLR